MQDAGWPVLHRVLSPLSDHSPTLPDRVIWAPPRYKGREQKLGLTLGFPRLAALSQGFQGDKWAQKWWPGAGSSLAENQVTPVSSEWEPRMYCTQLSSRVLMVAG